MSGCLSQTEGMSQLESLELKMVAAERLGFSMPSPGLGRGFM